MPTNDEKRNVARRLRNNADQKPSWVIPWAAFNDAYEHEGAELINRLADLIEPEERTCHMRVLENARGNPKRFLMYVCSECHGAVVHDKYDPIYYCPNCGSKVVDDHA